jgi:DNA-binding CsgD family transcriptional regulator
MSQIEPLYADSDTAIDRDELFTPFLATASPVLVIDSDGYVVMKSGPPDSALDPTDGSAPEHHHLLPIFANDARCLVCRAIQRAVAGGLPEGGTVRTSDRSVVYTVVLTAVFREKKLQGLVAVFTRCADLSTSPHPSAALQHRPHLTEMTPREREVLVCLARGMSARATGEHLHISHNTARNHMQNVLHKLDAQNKAEAVAQALSIGLLTLEDLK